jgi:chromate transport protein ChrA
VAAIAGAIVALLFDLVTHYDAFVNPKGSTAALALIFVPLWNTLVFSPVAIFVAWLFLRRRGRQVHHAP